MEEKNMDTIYRQDAIKALRRDEALVRAFGYHNAIDAIWNLPSAQPEQSIAEWQKDFRDEILKAGIEGREVEFRIGGRLFAIREKAQ